MTQAAHNKTAASEARDLAFETPRTVEVHGRALFAQKTMSEAMLGMSRSRRHVRGRAIGWESDASPPAGAR